MNEENIKGPSSTDRLFNRCFCFWKFALLIVAIWLGEFQLWRDFHIWKLFHGANCLLVESRPLRNQCSGCNYTCVLTQRVTIKLRDLVFSLSRNLLQLHIHGSDLLNFTEIRKPMQVIVSLASPEDNQSHVVMNFLMIGLSMGRISFVEIVVINLLRTCVRRLHF